METMLPSGTVTFLFTDIEGSMQLAQEQPNAWEALRARHHAILRRAVESRDGHVFQVIGDAFCCAFGTVRAALTAAVDAQRQLQAEQWGAMPLRVRMGIHTGEAHSENGDYTGYLTLAKVQRVMSAAYGEQILLSNSSAELLRAAALEDVSLLDLGEHGLKSLSGTERLWQVVLPGLRREFPPLSSVRGIPNNLPAELTSFVGRAAEMSEVQDLLQAARLVTLSGAGGTGKSRLSQRAAAEMLESFKDGVWLIELAPLSDPGLVPNAAASAMGVHEQQGRPLTETLLEWLASKECLLVLDNCEHLIAACAELTERLLRTCPHVRILATSREGLGVAGERIYVVPSLESPPLAHVSQMPLEEIRRYASVRLFTERARESLPRFTLTEANAPAVAQLCAHLDGIPLAIELAAARVKVLQVEQIAARLNDRFRLLTGGNRTALPRHQTLHSLIDWSYSLLSGQERILLRRLSVFAGGWTLEEAEEVCPSEGLAIGEVLDVLTHLVDKSLVIVEQARDEARYHMLETIRQYAREKMLESDEAAEVSDRHLRHMLALAELAERKLHSRDEGEWHDRLQQELDNLRAALEWASGREDPEWHLRLAGALYWFWWVRGYWHEGNRWLRGALSKPGAERRTKGRERTLIGLGFFQAISGELTECRKAFAESADICRELGDERDRVEAMAWLAWFIDPSSPGPDLYSVAQESLRLSRQLGDKLWIGQALADLGIAKMAEGDEQAAWAYYSEAVALLEDSGEKNIRAYTLRRLGYLALRRADPEKAAICCADSLKLNREIGDMRGVAACIASIAAIALQQRDTRRAARLYGAGVALRESMGGPWTPLDQDDIDHFLPVLRSELGEGLFSAAYAEGHLMTTEDAIAYALQQEKRSQSVNE